MKLVSVRFAQKVDTEGSKRKKTRRWRKRKWRRRRTRCRMRRRGSRRMREGDKTKGQNKNDENHQREKIIQVRKVFPKRGFSQKSKSMAVRV